MLIQTKEVTMRPEDVKRVFQNNAEDLVEWITKGGRSSLLVSNRKRKKSSFNEFFSWIPSSIKNTLPLLCLLHFLLLFAVFHYHKKKEKKSEALSTHMIHYDFTADGYFPSNTNRLQRKPLNQQPNMEVNQN